MRTTWDIFCKVIDNYGDIGVAARLARQLVNEYQVTVRLWVDDLHAFQRLWPDIHVEADTQSSQGVEVRIWRESFAAVIPAQVVIEAFGCALPAAYLHAMNVQASPAVWINLEYLSAERWVKTHHALPSPHPQLPLTKYFFFPGYEKGTGGVVCEGDLAGRRERFQKTQIPAFWQSLGVEPPLRTALSVSMFAYENAALPALLKLWRDCDQPVVCLIPEGKVVPQLAAWLGESDLPAGTVHHCGSLQLRILPFLNQNDYDHLLWACDINFVRGEDSCVRAQWAQKPFIWQPYSQAGNAHWDKLDALNRLYVEGLPTAEADAVTALWRAWNGRGDLPEAWAAFMQVKAAIEAHAATWTASLSALGDLAANLVAFVEDHEAG